MINQVTSGECGCSKSTKTFEQVSKEATINEPVLFVYKNYDLMLEQIERWSDLFKIDKKEFCICGTNLTYSKALEFYTNPDNPRFMNSSARFIFCTQAVVQRNKHLTFFSHPNTPKKFKYIVVDEFDFTVGLVPTLDYQMRCISDNTLKGVTEINILRWVLENYTHEDYESILREKYLHRNNFFLANWIQNAPCPIIFLTSEVLATEFLTLVGFKNVHIESPDAKDCVINVWSSPAITRNFFTAMNNEMVWGKVSEMYDLIISDNVPSFTGKEESMVTVVSHSGSRGSNNWRNKKILTILSHIPNQAVQEICDVFKAFGCEKSFDEVYRTFYRDRLCQAVGRTLGNRGGKVTDLIVHSSIMKELKNIMDFPYSFNTEWKFHFEGLEDVLSKIEIYKKNTVEKIKATKKAVEIITYGVLDNLFYRDPNEYLICRDIPNYLEKHNVTSMTGTKTLPVTKLAKYFNAPIKNKKINGVSTRCILGLTYRKEV